MRRDPDVQLRMVLGTQKPVSLCLVGRKVRHLVGVGWGGVPKQPPGRVGEPVPLTPTAAALSRKEKKNPSGVQLYDKACA